MIVGIPQECKNNEYRVSLMPQHIAAIAQTHKVIVQQDAGLGAGFSNEDYIRSGGIMVSSLEDVYAQANLIIKVIIFDEVSKPEASADLPAIITNINPELDED